MNKHTSFKQTGWLTAVPLTLLFLLLTTTLALAHTRVEIGPYAVVVGWLAEPPIVGERNALTVEITEEERPFTGAEATLDVELQYGGQTLRANLNPTTAPGLYTVDIFPTVRGQYSVRLFGTLGDEAVDELLEPEEVFPASRLQFPAPLPDGRELQQEITALENQLQTVRTIALAATGVALLALLLVAFLLLKNNRKKQS
jgi:hypothetical protein